MEMDESARADDARTETTQQTIFDTCTQMRELTTESEFISAAAAIEMVRLAVFMLNKVEEVDSVSELIVDTDFEEMKASVWGQLLMVMGTEHMTTTHKQFLIAVAEHMGSDWLEWLRRDVAFMVKVESF